MFINFSDCQVYGQAPQNVPAQKQTVKYTCPMHPEVVQDLPGICPKCGMKLVEKKDMHQSKDSTMMKKDHMMHDSTMMKKDHRMHD
jgi:Cu2+-exporting ATPase